MHKLYTDGGARGNPGPAAGGVVLYNEQGEVFHKASKYFGIGTNNQAEYKALLLGLNLAKDEGVQEISVYLDSELVVKQLVGLYKVKDTHLALLYAEIKLLESYFKVITYTHVPRTQNKEADLLVNKELDQNHT